MKNNGCTVYAALLNSVFVSKEDACSLLKSLRCSSRLVQSQRDAQYKKGYFIGRELISTLSSILCRSRVSYIVRNAQFAVNMMPCGILVAKVKNMGNSLVTNVGWSVFWSEKEFTKMRIELNETGAIQFLINER